MLIVRRGTSHKVRFFFFIALMYLLRDALSDFYKDHLFSTFTHASLPYARNSHPFRNFITLHARKYQNDEL